jgi:hypothetical protein
MNSPALWSLALSLLLVVSFLYVGRSGIRTFVPVAVLFGVLIAQLILFATSLFTVLISIVLMTIVAVVDASVFRLRRATKRRWLAAAAEPLILDPPFVGRWRVAAGGPDPAHNHHLIAPAQQFAYDFLKTEGQSLGEPILAPCSGTVVALSDGMPDRKPSMRADDESVRGRELGNYVAIDSGRGFVFLCHLQCGSVCVETGTAVRSGDLIGRCGNSGRTRGPHLHLHAQDIPTYALFEGRGVPVAFRSPAARTLQYGETIERVENGGT